MDMDKVSRLLRFRWLIFWVLATAYLFVYFHRLSLSVVADQIVRDFDTSAGVMGLLGSIYFYCYAAMQLPAGLLSDSIGPRKTVTVFLMVAAAGSILFGLAPDIYTAFIGRVLVGFGVSMVFIPTMKILSQWFRAKEFASMAGILNAVGGVGALAGTWFLAFMTSSVGWRTSFVIIGCCTLFLVLVVWFVVRDRPQDRGWPSILSVENTENKSEVKPMEIGLMEGAKRVLSNKYFWPVALWFFFDCGVFFGLGALWGGPYLMHVYGLSQGETGAVLSMIAYGMILGSPLLGFVSDRVLRSRKKPFMICTSILTGLVLCLYLFPDALPKPGLYAVFFLLSISSSSIVVIGFTTTKELFPVEMAGTSVGTVNLFPFLGGAVFMPFLGWILDAYPKTAAGGYGLEGYSVLLLVLLISSVSALICTFFMKETWK
jgi:sugar phosphate permease